MSVYVKARVGLKVTIRETISTLFPRARVIAKHNAFLRMCARCGDVRQVAYVMVQDEGLLCRSCIGVTNETGTKPKKEKKRK